MRGFCVTKFYSLWRRLFYRHGVLNYSGFNCRFVRLHVRFEIKTVVYRMPEILFAAEITLGRLDGRVSQ